MPPRKLRAIVGVDVTLLGSRLRNTSDTGRTGRRQRLGAPCGIHHEPANDQPGNADGDTQEGLRQAPSPTYRPVFRSSSHDEPIAPAVQPVSPRYRIADVKFLGAARAECLWGSRAMHTLLAMDRGERVDRFRFLVRDRAG
jgi:hypothetical protein